MFDYKEADNAKLSTKDSVVPDINKVQEVSTMKQYQASYPSMCKEIESITGISTSTMDPNEAELFNDAFETKFTEFETKYNTVYTED